MAGAPFSLPHLPRPTAPDGGPVFLNVRDDSSPLAFRVWSGVCESYGDTACHGSGCVEAHKTSRRTLGVEGRLEGTGVCWALQRSWCGGWKDLDLRSWPPFP